ncbi:DNA-directed RNA polymerase [Thecamonas trahens ATCC 50062]|uniref:DNA-directed RNA polymerase subunit beta n=1 Tax=Thecamonas trahens ATCC 50062 TaxID=461836 RepID=A0A0L0D9T0_THETB|nr:DNA-directed RNA polymerase [Thecamonas trahens ATCC 50062]KNC48846.1 DNA-directed RNA polymerase [Thecamonas trahens ATCC 50062]|eukprot:XP_013758266.1 DNA-directed RNA polymerase [Thecamonas trahens ATCC 50062]
MNTAHRVLPLDKVEKNALRAAVVAPHIESFNHFINTAIPAMVKDIQPMYVEAESPAQQSVKLWISSFSVGKPVESASGVANPTALLPSACRERNMSYSAPMHVRIMRSVDGGPPMETAHEVGLLPIMVQSDKCHLKEMSPKELVAVGEEASEAGGYFIVNGREKILRMLIMPRRHYPTAIIRPSFAKRGPQYSQYAVSLRSVRPDCSSVTNNVHYLNNGHVNFRFLLRKREYFVPVAVLLRALMPTTDREMFERLAQGNFDNTYLVSRLEILLCQGQKFALYTQEQALAFLGSRFRPMLYHPRAWTDAEVGRALIRDYVFIHLGDDLRAKYDLTISMVQKLYALVQGHIQPDSSDAANNQEILVVGHLFGAMLRELLEKQLGVIKLGILRAYRRGDSTTDVENAIWFSRLMARSTMDIGKRFAYLMATGNLKSDSGLNMGQVVGYTIMAEKLNVLRFLAHFRCVHRGAFFSEMKTTSVRKLLPENYGFLCPVHTPDGAPCGLLNHLAAKARVVSTEPPPARLLPVLASLGVRMVTDPGVAPLDHVPVFLEGRIVGSVAVEHAAIVADQLRHFKVHGKFHVPATLEIAYVASELPVHLVRSKAAQAPALPAAHGSSSSESDDDAAAPPAGKDAARNVTLPPGQFPGIYLFSGPGRLMRPVTNLREGKQELIGSFEQLYLHVACLPDDILPGITTHKDESPTDMLSVVALLTPFSDFNQSPRNMYQCQMGKQTFGSPSTAYAKRTDNKMYRIRTPQTPIVQTEAHSAYQIDEFPQGMNAIVAVISYTGYDMEDAMIINKQSYERGFAHGSMYKTDLIDLSETSSDEHGIAMFCNIKPGTTDELECKELDADGLPPVGTLLTKGSPYYARLNPVASSVTIVRYKYEEPAYVDQVRVMEPKTAMARNLGLVRVSIKLRYVRNPIIGDKFSSRHGQKGVLSQLWPMENMPFTESGITPDIIINPHAFPSRMTIGMLIEIMAAKSGALYGKFQDATPFSFIDNGHASEFFGEQLRSAGYNYYGSEPMYSGITGTEFSADIFMGVCYWQRLRHLVSDKHQVRATGPVSDLTRQPVKGRKRAGGIRFGEMERDSLIAHGTSFLLQDRLLKCSDAHTAFVCATCGSLAAVSSVQDALTGVISPVCTRTTCKGGVVRELELPYVFRYLVAELGAMGIAMELDVRDLE